MKSFWKMVDIGSIEYNSFRGLASIEIHDPETGQEGFIRFSEILLFKISNSYQDMNGPHIADLTLSEFNADDGEKILRDKGYDFVKFQMPEKLYYLHGEASVVLDVIAGKPFEFVTDVGKNKAE